MSKNKKFWINCYKLEKNNNLFDLKFLKNYFKNYVIVLRNLFVKQKSNINRFFKFYKCLKINLTKVN